MQVLFTLLKKGLNFLIFLTWIVKPYAYAVTLSHLMHSPFAPAGLFKLIHQRIKQIWSGLKIGIAASKIWCI